MAGSLESLFLDLIHHLDAEGQGSASFDGCGHVYGFHHLFFVGAFGEAIVGVGIYAVGALYGMGYGQGNEGLFALSQSAFFEDFAIPIEEFFAHFLLKLGDVGKLGEIIGIEVRALIGSHDVLLSCLEIRIFGESKDNSMPTAMVYINTNKLAQVFVGGLFLWVILFGASCEEGFSLRKPRYGALPSFASADTVWFVVENAAGTLPRMRYDGASRGFQKVAGGEAQFLPLPVNQGFIPREGEEQREEWPDALLLAEALPRGEAIEAIPLAVLHLRESGHRRSLTLCIPLDSGRRILPIDDFSDFMIEGEAARRLLELWYRQHLGYGRVQIEGWGEVE